MVSVTAFVVLANAVSLALGGVITHLAYRAYRRTGSPALGRLSAGFGVVTAGILVGGALHVLLAVDVASAVLARNLLTAAGFGIIAYSLYAGGPTPQSA